MSEHSPKHLTIVGMVFLGILAGFLVWLLYQTWFNYKNMRLSTTLMDQLLEYQSGLTRVHEHRSAMFKTQLDQTRDLVEKYRNENQQLLDRIQLQDEVVELQGMVESLQEENKLIRTQMSSLQLDQPVAQVKVPQVRSLKEARNLIRGKKQEIKKIRLQIHNLKQEMVQQQIADQKEVDRIESLLGNHGYLVKEGKICSQRMALPEASQQVSIDVTIVP